MRSSLFRSFASARPLQAVLVAFLLAVVVAGCNSFDPSQWTQEQVAKDIGEQWNLVSVDLKPTAGGYSGTGKSAEGETFKLTVKVDSAARSVSYHGEGDRGDILDYSVRAETVR